MKKLFIIQTGSTFSKTAARSGDFDEMALRGLALPRQQTHVVRAHLGDPLPAAKDCLGVVITGAHCMVTDDLPWSLAIEQWLSGLVKKQVPILGVCYGHQLLGRAMGGIVEDHPHGKEVGTFEIRLTSAAKSDPLFCDLPPHFPVHATHTQSVTTLPPQAILLAGNDFEPHHAMRLGHSAWGVQFHPEYDSRVMRDYIHAQADSLTEAEQDVTILLDRVVETPYATSLLARFGKISLENTQI